MKAADFDINIINFYFNLLKNLNKENKKKLISKLKDSIDSDSNHKRQTVAHLYGAFASDKGVEEIIHEVRKSRVFKRKIEEFE